MECNKCRGVCVLKIRAHPLRFQSLLPLIINITDTHSAVTRYIVSALKTALELFIMTGWLYAMIIAITIWTSGKALL
jgi:hypothetical protein